MTGIVATHGLLASFDYYGAAALVAAFGAILASVFSFLNGRKATTIQARTEHIADAVTTSNGATLAELADATEARRVDQLPPFAGETRPHVPPTS